jgi:hypothetical protein
MAQTRQGIDPKMGALEVPDGSLFSAQMVADLFGVSAQMVRKWARKYHYGQLWGDRWAFSDADLMHFAQRRGPGRPTAEEMEAAKKRLAGMSKRQRSLLRAKG